ncbi:HAUS augmin-like complex subunit 8 isoform X2 [Ostrea edulis]|nr:HAUS augmin-like complex subunit 8 isoform X2 [Ostrea edulis]
MTDEEREPSASITPRKKAPRTTEQNSPARVRKTDTLDLSDSDEEIAQNSQLEVLGQQKSYPDGVMVLDASCQLIDMDQTEVDVVVGYRKSPARVVCHSPAAAKRQLRNSAMRGEPNKVSVSNVPAIPVTSPVMSKPSNKSSPVVKEKLTGILRSTDEMLGALPVLTQMERMMGLPQPNFDDSGDSEDLQQPPEKSDVMSLISESDACSIADYVTKPVTRNKKSANTAKTAPKTPGTAKKKTKVVASRYMQAAQAKGSVSILMDKSSRADRSKASRSLDNHTTQTNYRGKKQPRDKKLVEPPKHPSTPEKVLTTKTGKTSTPTSDISFFSTLQTDISAISTGGDTSKLHSDSHSKLKHKHNITQQDLDLLYGRLVQWDFLACKAKKIKEEQERKAMSQLSWLQEEVQKLRKIKHEKDKELARLKHLNELDEQLDIQKECLEPVVGHLPKLTKQYEILAQALDTTRHQIPTKGVYIPQDEELFHRQLEQTLQESEYLLGDLSATTGQSLQSATATVAKHVSALEKHTNQQCQQLKHCNEMIAATQSLTIEESSLIQQREITYHRTV